MASLDERLNGVAIEEQRSEVQLRVDWAPAYELIMSLTVYLYVSSASHSLIELGQPWAAKVRKQLPASLLQQLSRKPVAKSFKEREVDRLVQLVQADAGPRDATGFIEWFARLSAGATYEALAHSAAEPGPQLPRDFTDWRDSTAEALSAWNSSYFAHIEPDILSGLARSAAELAARLPVADPIAFVEEVTNGVLVEPGPAVQQVVLVPQYHNRPYNDTVEIRDGAVILFPCDVLPMVDPHLPPPRLMRLTRALGDESRLRILRFLREGPCSLTEVARFVGLSQPTVHHHLTQLRIAGLVQVHMSEACPSRYSLRPHALEQLSEQLGSYLLSDLSEENQ